MEILVAVLVVALLAGLAFVALQRRPGGAPGLRRPRASAPSVRARRRPRTDSMTAAVVEHAQVTDPAEVPAAEQRLRAQAQQVAAPLQAEADRVEQQRAADPGAPAGAYADPAYADPAAAPAVDEPYGDRYDPRYDGTR
jgi:hypothetical protein